MLENFRAFNVSRKGVVAWGVFKKVTSSINDLIIECLLEAQNDAYTIKACTSHFIEKRGYILWYAVVAVMLGVIIIFGFPHTVYAETIESIFQNARTEINRFLLNYYS